MIRFRLAVPMAFASMMGLAAAQVPSTPRPLPPISPAPPSSSPLSPLPQPQVFAPSAVPTSRGPGLVSGSPGSAQSVMIPGSAIPGTMLNNGNGTSTVIIPGSPSQVVPTPR
jgi:hypothetical protein